MASLSQASTSLKKAAKARPATGYGVGPPVSDDPLDLLAREVDDVLSRVVATALALGVEVRLTFATDATPPADAMLSASC